MAYSGDVLFPVSNREGESMTACLDETVSMLIAGRHSPLLKDARDEIRVIVNAGTKNEPRNQQERGIRLCLKQSKDFPLRIPRGMMAII